jgi:hypothetical protein
MSARGILARLCSHLRYSSPARPWTALLVAGLSIAGPGQGPEAFAANGAQSSPLIELRTGARYVDRGWENSDGKNSAGQFYLPLDLLWRSRSVRLSAGADWSRSGSDLSGQPTTAVFPCEFRASSEFGLMRDRLRVGAGVRLPFFDAGLTPEEAATAELLDEVMLEFPRARHPGGPAVLLEVGGQPLRRAGLVVQTGLAWEHRGSYEFLADDRRRIDPGDPWRLGLGVLAGRGEYLSNLAFRWEKAGSSELDSGVGYQEGSFATVQAGVRRRRERGELGVSAALTTRADGTVDPGAPLDSSALRGGNSVRITVRSSRTMTAGELGASFSLFGVRDYPGDLGHAAALEPGLTWSCAFSGGRLDIGGHGVWGRCRGDRPFHGFGLAVSWSGEWRR